jgi:Bacteriophage lambda head decoration protein D
MVDSYTFGKRAADFVLSEGNGAISRENGTLLSGESVVAGQVLGAVEVGAASATADAGNTGTGTFGTITVGAGAKAGVYHLEIIEPGTNAGVFYLEDPDGIEVATGTVGVAFNQGGLAFTLSDATDFVSGDGFKITVAAGSGKLRAFATAHTDGSQHPTVISLYTVDATDGDKAISYIARHAEVNLKALTYPSGQDSAVIAGLLTRGIIARN